MKLKSTAILTFILLTCSMIACADTTVTPTPTVTTTPEGYHGIGWGAALDDFKTSQKSSTSNSIKRTEKIAVLYLLMNFHEADKKDNYHPTKISIQKTAEDKTDYVFYNGHYCLAVIPIELKNLKAVQKEISSKYEAMKDVLTYNVQWTYSDVSGWSDMAFDYQQYVKTPSTRIYLVTVSSFNEDQGLVDQLHYGDVVQHIAGPKTAESTYLIYASEDYFKSDDNAWADYQTAKMAVAEPTKVITVIPTQTVTTPKESSQQQDLKSVE